jgi:eukaryotic-like serine/threonine-protein kinase
MSKPELPRVKHPHFALDGFRYQIYATQVEDRDYATLYQAWRTTVATGERIQVLLKPVAVSKESEQRGRYWEEVHLAVYLEHPNIGKVRGFTVAPDRTTYVVSDAMPGLYLATALDFGLLIGRKVSHAFAAYVAAMVARALDHAHTRENGGIPLNIIHRGVGPMRIRVGFDGRVKLTDFGLAYNELRDRLKTPPGILRGDAAYAAPELWRAVMDSSGPAGDSLIARKVDGRADVFSLGLTLLEALLALYALDPVDIPEDVQKPHVARKVTTEQHVWTDPEVLADRALRFDVTQIKDRLGELPKDLGEIVRRSLQPDPRERFTAAQMRDGLREYLAKLPRPYDQKEAGAELSGIYGAAKSARRLLGSPIERTALSDLDDGEG